MVQLPLKCPIPFVQRTPHTDVMAPLPAKQHRQRKLPHRRTREQTLPNCHARQTPIADAADPNDPTPPRQGDEESARDRSPPYSRYPTTDIPADPTRTDAPGTTTRPPSSPTGSEGRPAAPASPVPPHHARFDSSTITWALVPPKPNELTPAIRPRSPRRQRQLNRTCNGKRQSICGLGSSK